MNCISVHFIAYKQRPKDNLNILSDLYRVSMYTVACASVEF